MKLFYLLKNIEIMKTKDKTDFKEINLYKNDIFNPFVSKITVEYKEPNKKRVFIHYPKAKYIDIETQLRYFW